MRFLLLFLFLSNFALANKLKIKSQPESADIFIVNSGKPVRIGVTPFEANLNEVMNNYVKSPSFVVEINKRGHKPYRLLIAKTAEADLELTANLELDETATNLKEHDLLMNQLFDVQKLIRGRSFQSAIDQLSELEKKHPHFSIIPELKGTAYYMNKEIESALSFYRKAFAINPENVDAYRMKVYLEKKLGVDSEIR